MYSAVILSNMCYVVPTRMKVVNLKQAILQAWKERWSDYQWAINIKKNFPKGATWDYPNLAGLKIYDLSELKILFFIAFSTSANAVYPLQRP